MKQSQPKTDSLLIDPHRRACKASVQWNIHQSRAHKILWPGFAFLWIIL
jgi:hypothetical protein